MKERFWLRLILLVSVAVVGVVSLLYSLPRSGDPTSAWLAFLPRLNAALNTGTALLLGWGWILIRKGNKRWHHRVMLTAFTLSAAFLISYVIYHSLQTGPTHYQGAYRGWYFFFLLTHILLAAGILPLVLVTLLRGLTGQWTRHRAWARWTLPLWLYVACSGVIVFGMLYL